MNKYKSDFTNKEYTENKFLENVEKRVRKELRVNSELDVKKTYALIDDNKLSTKVILYLLDNIFSGRLTVALFQNKKDIPEGSFEICSDVLEEYITKKLEIFLKNKTVDELSVKTITPLKIVTASEIKQISEIKGFEGINPEKENELISQLHKIYPQTKTSMVKSFRFIEEL